MNRTRRRGHEREEAVKFYVMVVYPIRPCPNDPQVDSQNFDGLVIAKLLLGVHHATTLYWQPWAASRLSSQI